MNRYAMIAIRSMLFAVTFITACGGGDYGSGSQPPPPPPPVPAAPTVTVDAAIKQLIFNWDEVPGASHYKLLENPDGGSGFTQAGEDLPAGTISATLDIAVHLYDFANALYIVQACNSTGCTGSTEVNAINSMLDTIGYFKASNTQAYDEFGGHVALSADGNTLAVGTYVESSSATGINGDQSDNSAGSSGAAYVFRFDGTDWNQQAYVKASNADANDDFGRYLALSADGNTLAVGANTEVSGGIGVNGDQSFDDEGSVGAAYVFRFDGIDWFQQAYFKASNTKESQSFGIGISLSADGTTLAVGAPREGSSTTGINGDQNDESARHSGAVYLFRFDGADWYQQAYVKASNTDEGDQFGWGTALSSDGNTLAVGANGEDSSATGINGDQNDNSAEGTGAVYVFRFDGTDWFQEAYVKASNSASGDGISFEAVALSADGNILAVKAGGEDSAATGINGDQNDNSTEGAGAAYLFRFDGTDWFQDAYVKASNTEFGDRFGSDVALSADGSTLVVSAEDEGSSATGINGDQSDNSAENAGAVYLY